jgi:large-conductance mechanosensitive channel
VPRLSLAWRPFEYDREFSVPYIGSIAAFRDFGGYETILIEGGIMDQTGQAFTLQGPGGRKWVGRIIVAVILGEAIWNLIVSIMNNVIVPWLGDFFGQSSGLPTSFTQRPYNYPDLFVSVVEFCIAGLVAAIFNYFLERRGRGNVRTMKVPVLQKTEDVQVVSQPVPAPATQVISQMSPAVPVGRPSPISPTPPVVFPAASPLPAPASQVNPVPPAKPVEVPAAAPRVMSSGAKAASAAPKAEQPKPKKPKEVYYNIVGEPMPPDED